MDLTFETLKFSSSFEELSNDEMDIINGGVFPALIVFGITISPLLWVPAAIAGVYLLIDRIYVSFRQTYENLKKKYS